MDRRGQIERTLEIVAARHGDPAPMIYVRLFAARPEFEVLFTLDRAGAARGNMLVTALDAILDIAGPNSWGMNFLLAEQVNHQGFNVPPTDFLIFVDAVHATFQELAGPDWAGEMDTAWGSVIAEIHAACAKAQPPHPPR